ncbi:hypothetical protein [[Phormidium] sp. ETS-05]|uniref:hypothetical protein n=1 Tax=[Phormidium] sp. ETS-05 TaxID=222819 RepID=UPI0018EEF6FF|nr:hypothetical protein [[Phormidium] sp. ETS-05]
MASFGVAPTDRTIATAFRHGLKSVAEWIKPPMGVILPGVRIFRPRATIHQRCEQT